MDGELAPPGTGVELTPSSLKLLQLAQAPGSQPKIRKTDWCEGAKAQRTSELDEFNESCYAPKTTWIGWTLPRQLQTTPEVHHLRFKPIPVPVRATILHTGGSLYSCAGRPVESRLWSRLIPPNPCQLDAHATFVHPPRVHRVA